MIRPRPDVIRPYVKPRLHGARRPRGPSGGATRRRAEDLASAEIDRQERAREFAEVLRNVPLIPGPPSGGSNIREPEETMTWGPYSSTVPQIISNAHLAYLSGPFYSTGWC